MAVPLALGGGVKGWSLGKKTNKITTFFSNGH